MLRPATEAPTRKVSASSLVPELQDRHDLQVATTQFRSEASESGEPNLATHVFEPPAMLGAIGEYDLVRRLGRRVFVGHHRATRQPFAIRVLDAAPHYGAWLAQRQLAEAHALATIEHPNVARVIDVGADAGRVYLVMEYLRGATLASVLELHGALSGPQAIRICALVAKALDAAHRRGVVHKNLEAGSVIVLPSERGRSTIKLVDFALSESPEVVRIPRHSMSPELCSGEPVDHRTDLYSLGVLLHRVCTGRDPFEGSPMEILAMHRFRSVVRPAPALEGVPAELAEVIRRCLSADPAARYASAAEVLEALRGNPGASAELRATGSERMAAAALAAIAALGEAETVPAAPAALAAAMVAAPAGAAVPASAPNAAVPASAPNAVVRDGESGILVLPGGAPVRIATAVPLEGKRARAPRRLPWKALLVLAAAMVGGSVLALSTMDRGGGGGGEAAATALAAPAAPAAAPAAPGAASQPALVPDAVSAPDAIAAGAVRVAPRVAAEVRGEPERKPPHREHRSKSRRSSASASAQGSTSRRVRPADRDHDDDDDTIVIISDGKSRVRRGRSRRADP